MQPDEFQDLYHRYGPAVRARCRAMCGNGADADDVLQETFLAAWRAADRFDGRHPLAWLHTIARRKTVDLLRRRRPWRSDPNAWLNVPQPYRGERSSPVDVARALDQLGPEDAAMLRLRYAESWRIHEIAEHFETSQRSVRRRLQQIEKRMRAVLRTREVLSA